MNDSTQAVRDVLTELEVMKVEKFCADKDMYEAVRKVLLSGIYTHGVVQKGVEHNPLVNGAFSLVALAVQNPIPDAELGAHLRGQWMGVNALESAFNTLGKIKSSKEEPVESPFNDAI